jgi:hypothetical protein
MRGTAFVFQSLAQTCRVAGFGTASFSPFCLKMPMVGFVLLVLLLGWKYFNIFCFSKTTKSRYVSVFHPRAAGEVENAPLMLVQAMTQGTAE